MRDGSTATRATRRSPTSNLRRCSVPWGSPPTPATSSTGAANTRAPGGSKDAHRRAAAGGLDRRPAGLALRGPDPAQVDDRLWAGRAVLPLPVVDRRIHAAGHDGAAG